MYVYIYIYIYIDMYICVCMCIYIYIYKYIHTHAHMYVHTDSWGGVRSHSSEGGRIWLETLTELKFINSSFSSFSSY